GGTRVWGNGKVNSPDPPQGPAAPLGNAAAHKPNNGPGPGTAGETTLSPTSNQLDARGMPRKRVSPVTLVTETIDNLWAWFGQDAMPRMAAALAYRTIFSLIPLLLLSFLTLRLFQNSGDVIGGMLRKLLDLSGLSALAVDDGSKVGPSVLDARPEVLDQIRALLGADWQAYEAAQRVVRDGQASSVERWITQMVTNFDGINFGAIGLVSAATLIYAALSLLVEVESSFNAIYGASRGRSWVRRVLQYWLVISLGPLMLYAGFIVADKFKELSGSLAAGTGQAAGPWLVHMTGYLATVSISTALLLVLYVIVPNTVVRFRAALVGAFVGGLLLELAKFSFARYFSAEGYKSVFGALALLPLFLLWVYIIWFIVLFGLRVSFLLQNGKRGVLLGALRASNGLGLAGGSWVEPARSVGVALAIAEAFDKGHGAQVERLCETAEIPEQNTRMLLQRLEDAGIVHRVARERGASAGKSEVFMLSRPADQILVGEIVAVGQLLAGPVAPGPSGELIGKIRKAQVDAVGQITLASLLRPIRPAARPNPSAPAPGVAALRAGTENGAAGSPPAHPDADSGGELPLSTATPPPA
ncbi:MAG: YhjD/YihY/BrkB family envelope integrity protein, partial [Phycisphaerales bacterium]